VKYFFEMEIQFYRGRTAESEEEITDFQYTTAAFFTTLMTSDQLSLPAIVVGQLMLKITEFGCENNC